MLRHILDSKMVELTLMMMGIPKSEINSMTRSEIQVLLHLVSYMSRDSGDNA